MGSYKNGQKNGRWTEIAESGDTIVIETYLNGKEEGLHVSYSGETGMRTKEYYLKNDRKDGIYREYDLKNGELKYEATYQFGRLHGKARQLVVDNRFDYWETSTYVNGRQNGPFEARYVLTHPALFNYLQERGIDTALAKPECKELHFIHNGKPYFAIGFPNVAGGYEVRNPFFKGCIAPKDISHIRQQGEPREKCLVFEGMMDYLSFLTLRMKNCPTMPNLDGQDYVILNSVANVSKIID